MKKYAKKQVEKTYLDEITCDCCGRTHTDDRDWSEERYYKQETTIEYTYGSTYPDGGMGESIRIDLCPDCFEHRLLSLLQKEDVHINTTKWDY